MKNPIDVAALLETLTALTHDPTALAIAGVVVLFLALVSCRLFVRAGHPGGYGLLMLVPGVNVIMLLILAFGRWPIERELRALRLVARAARNADARGYSRVA